MYNLKVRSNQEWVTRKLGALDSKWKALLSCSTEKQIQIEAAWLLQELNNTAPVNFSVELLIEGTDNRKWYKQFTF